jgi:hypothetical protein
MIDFEDLDFPHDELPNNNKEDLEYAIKFLCDMYAEDKLDPAHQVAKDKLR